MSRRFRILFTVLIFCIPVVDVVYWLAFNHLPEGITKLPTVAHQELSHVSRALAFLVSLIPVSVAVFGMVTLAKLFRLYENAVVFAAENVRHVRRLGYVCIVWVMANMVFVSLISVIGAFGNPPGQRMMVVQFGLADVSALMIGAVVWLISWVMDEGRKLENEQAFTV